MSNQVLSYHHNKKNNSIIHLLILLVKGARSQFQYHIFFIPNRSVACEQLLEDDGVLDIVNIGEYHLGLIPFDDDIVTLEINDLYKQCYVDNDLSTLETISRSLYKLQNIYGIIPNIISKGISSKKVLSKLLHYCCESQDVDERSKVGMPGGQGWNGNDYQEGIDTLVLVDREVDLFSCLLTPLTYEGLVDECIGIDNGRIKVDVSILGDDKDQSLQASNVVSSSSTTSQQQEVIAAAIASSVKSEDDENKKFLKDNKVSILLNSKDNIFQECRDLSIEGIIILYYQYYHINNSSNSLTLTCCCSSTWTISSRKGNNDQEEIL